jgi:hypothetical protein
MKNKVWKLNLGLIKKIEILENHICFFKLIWVKLGTQLQENQSLRIN